MPIFAVVSAKGGVGKTTLVANVGAALARYYKKKVLVIDGNVTTPNLGIHLGIISQERTIHDVLDGQISLQKAVYIHPSGVEVLPASLSINRQANLENLKECLIKASLFYDIILIDGSAGIGKEAISAIQASDFVLIVCNPEMTSIVSAIKIIKIAKSLNAQIFGIVLNRVMKGKGEITPEKIEELCEAKVIFTVPYDRKVPESIANMTPIVLYKPESKAGQAFRELAGQLIGVEGEKIYRKEGFLNKILKFFKLRAF